MEADAFVGNVLVGYKEELPDLVGKYEKGAKALRLLLTSATYNHAWQCSCNCTSRKPLPRDRLVNKLPHTLLLSSLSRYWLLDRKLILFPMCVSM